MLDEKGSPTPVERAYIYPPRSHLTPLTAEERLKFVEGSALFGHYEKAADRESAFEKLRAKAEERKTESEAPLPSRSASSGEKSQVEVLVGAMVKSAAHAIGSQIGRQIIRGVLGSILGGRR